MKIRSLPLLFLPLLAHADEKKTQPSLTEELLSGEIWSKSLVDLKNTYDPPQKKVKESDDHEIPDEIRKEMEKKGFKITKGSFKREKFKWLSSKKVGLRAEGKKFTLLDKEVGEIILRSSGDKIANATVSIYNRGDDGQLKRNDYTELLNEWRMLLNEHLSVRPRQRDGKGVVKTTGWVWSKHDTAYLLEGSISRKTNRAEFIRLRIAPKNKNGRVKKMALRSDLVKNVKKNEKGDTFIDGIPMVDQGQKGYCVVASIERVGLYYGLSVDQHEMAQVANTTEDGTRSDIMEKAFKKITGKIHARTIKLMDYDYKQTVRDVKSYNREAKKQGAKIYEIDFDTHYVNTRGFWQRVDKDVFKTIKAKQNKYKFFQTKVKEYINQGIPICWTLSLGMFKEEGLPQSFGGHMRIIHGYNEGSQEILYTDSWGEGHEMKKMPAIEAWCMTTGIYAMVPTN